MTKLYRIENHSDKEIRLSDANGTVIPPRGSVIVDEVRPSLNIHYLTVKSFDAVDQARETEQLRHALEKSEFENRMMVKENDRLREEMLRMERVLHMLERQQNVYLSGAPLQTGKMPTIPGTAPTSTSATQITEFQPKTAIVDTSKVTSMNIANKPRGKTNVASKKTQMHKVLNEKSEI